MQSQRKTNSTATNKISQIATFLRGHQMFCQSIADRTMGGFVFFAKAKLYKAHHFLSMYFYSTNESIVQICIFSMLNQFLRIFNFGSLAFQKTKEGNHGSRLVGLVIQFLQTLVCVVNTSRSTTLPYHRAVTRGHVLRRLLFQLYSVCTLTDNCGYSRQSEVHNVA